MAPDLEAQSFTIRAPLDAAAQDFAAEVPGTQAFVEASRDDRITLEAGYRDLAGNETLVGQVRKGIPDEWEFTLTPRAISTLVRGRDPMERLLARPITKLYPRAPRREVVETIAGPGEGGGNLPTLTVAEAPAGRWRASQIAADVIATVNATVPGDQQLGLSWETRDYEIRADYSASGRPLDVLRDLAEPWNQVPAFAIEIVMVGLTVVVRNRVPVPTADHVIALGDARVRQLTITKRLPRFTGQIVLSGMPVQIEGEGIIGEGLPDPTVEIEETPNRTDITVKTATGEFVYGMPEGILLSADKPVFAANNRPGGGGSLEMIKRETIVNDWIRSDQFDNGRPVEPARLKSQVTTIEGIHPKDKKVRVLRRLGTEEVTAAYDSGDYLERVTTIKREEPHKAPGTLELKTMVTKDYTDLGGSSPQHEIVTSSWRWENKAGIWLLEQRDSVVVSGYRPGGPRVLKSFFIPAGVRPGANNSGQLIPVTLAETISTDPAAEPFSYENENLTLADLRFIANQFRAASGLWEYELGFPGVTMPWVKKGVGIQFTGCRDSADELIPFHANLPAGHLRPALVIETTLRYVEGEGLESQVRAVYWSKEE